MKSLFTLVTLATALIASAGAEPIAAITNNNRLIIVDPAVPASIIPSIAITGLGGGETIVAIDYRPATGGLYGLGSSSRLYLINSSTGVATAVGAAGAFTLSGSRFGFDFNPTVDRIRVTSDTDQNLRLNPNDGTVVATDGTLAYAATDPNAAANPNVTGSAYTNNFAGATATTLYGIDSTLNTLVLQNPPNSGTLVTVGSLGVDPDDSVGFDISGVSGQAYASLSVGGTVSLYSINLLSGAATLVGPIGDALSLNGGTVTDIAVATRTRLVNLSSRGRVGTGADVLIGGFVAKGAAQTTVLFRAIAPSLGAFGVVNPLPDPTLAVYDSAGNQIGLNDDWMSQQAAEITATGFAPTNNLEAAILLRLPPGSYTVIVGGKNGATGVAVVEAYEIQ